MRFHPQEGIKFETEPTGLDLLFDSGIMMFNKTVIILCIAIFGAAWIEATEEHPMPEELLEFAFLTPEQFQIDDGKLSEDDHLDSLDCFESSSTPRPEQFLILESLLYLDSLSYPTFEKSTTPLPSSTTEDDLSHQLSKPSHITENRPSEKTKLTVATTTEDGIGKKKSSPAKQTDKESISQKLILSPLPDEDGITSEKIKPSIESMLNAINIIGCFIIAILIIVLFLVIREKCYERKIVEFDVSKFGQYPNMVYHTTIEVDNLRGKSVK